MWWRRLDVLLTLFGTNIGVSNRPFSAFLACNFDPRIRKNTAEHPRASQTLMAYNLERQGLLLVETVSVVALLFEPNFP